LDGMRYYLGERRQSIMFSLSRTQNPGVDIEVRQSCEIQEVDDLEAALDVYPHAVTTIRVECDG